MVIITFVFWNLSRLDQEMVDGQEPRREEIDELKIAEPLTLKLI